jgi:hypothetical protein
MENTTLKQPASFFILTSQADFSSKSEQNLTMNKTPLRYLDNIIHIFEE